MDYQNQIQHFAKLIDKHNLIVAFTGAGISTDSGIPDLAAISDILQKEEGYSSGIFGMLNRTFATNNPELFYQLYRKTFFHPHAHPNACHYFLANLEQEGKIKGIVTMNIDYLHQKAGSKIVHEFWGNMRINRCTVCEQEYDWGMAQNYNIPICHKCGGVIIPDFVFRNLGTYPENISNGNKILNQADLIIIAGTKQTWRSASIDVPKVIINMQHPDTSNKNTFYIQGNIASVFTDLQVEIKKRQKGNLNV